MKETNVRILIAAGAYPPDPGGSALHAFTQYNWFHSHGITVSIVKLRDYLNLPFGVRHIVYVLKLLFNSASFDLIYAHDAAGVGLPALFVSWIRHKKLIIRIGGDILWEREAERGSTDLSLLHWYKLNHHKKKKLFRIIRFVLKHTDVIVVPATILKTLYTDAYGIDPQKIRVIANPIPISGDTEAYEEPRTILFASRLVRYKNLGFVIRVLDRMHTDYPDLQFRILGDGPDRTHLESIISGDYVKFLGRVPETQVIEETKRAYLCLAPALTEFNPNYILRGVSMGKPFLMSSENGVPFEIPEQFLFDPTNEEEFEAKLRYVLTTEGYAQATAFVSNINFTQSWEDVMRENMGVALSLFESQQ